MATKKELKRWAGVLAEDVVRSIGERERLEAEVARLTAENQEWRALYAGRTNRKGDVARLTEENQALTREVQWLRAILDDIAKAAVVPLLVPSDEGGAF